jgi:uncharacterized protein YbaA (DUF1428 family)
MITMAAEKPQSIVHRREKPAMSYVDAFIAAVPTANRETYLKHAAKVAELFKEFGALSYVECWQDDVPEGELTSFPLAVQRKPEEAVVLGWAVWPSKATREEAWKKMMSDERMSMSEMPFDGKRMIYGGFEPVLET